MSIEIYDEKLKQYKEITPEIIMRKFKMNQEKANEIFDKLQELRYGRHIKEQIKINSRIDKIRTIPFN